MHVDLIVWDDEDDPLGNVRHIEAAGLTPADVDSVIINHPGRPDRPDDYSESSGLPMIFGDTPDGRRIVVVYEDESDGGLVVIRPRTAYPVRRRGD
jgi:hypothetical protein